MSFGDKFKKLLKKDAIKIIKKSGLWDETEIRRCSDNVTAKLSCAITQDLDEMLLENYRTFEVEGALGLYLNSINVNVLCEDWDNAFVHPPIAKQEYIINGQIYEIRKAFNHLGVFYQINFSSLGT